MSSTAHGVSADASTIVGSSSSAAGEEAFVWDAVHGMRSVRDLLEGRGLELGGWSLNVATAVSDDGRTVAGTGVNPDGATEAWLAVIPR